MAHRQSRPAAVRRLVDPMTRFLRAEAAGGVALLVATVCALLWANLWPAGYEESWARVLDAGVLRLDLRHWINDLLMAVFFFVVGLEIKRELVVGELRDRRAAALPVIAALGGGRAAGDDLPRNHRREAGVARLGDPVGDGHRVRRGRPGAARRPRVVRR